MTPKNMEKSIVKTSYIIIIFFSSSQYYAHREKLKVVGRENDIDAMNTAALKIARKVADEHGALMAGNICNSTIFIADDTESYKKVEEVFKVIWKVMSCLYYLM